MAQRIINTLSGFCSRKKKGAQYVWVQTHECGVSRVMDARYNNNMLLDLYLSCAIGFTDCWEHHKTYNSLKQVSYLQCANLNKSLRVPCLRLRKCLRNSWCSPKIGNSTYEISWPFPKFCFVLFKFSLKLLWVSSKFRKCWDNSGFKNSSKFRFVQ